MLHTPHPGSAIKSVQRSGTSPPTAISPSSMHETCIRATKYPHTIRPIDGAIHRFTTPRLATNENDMNVVVHIVSASMAIPACKPNVTFGNPKAMQRHHDYRKVRLVFSNTGSGPSISLFVFTEASDHGSRVCLASRSRVHR